jgi:Clr5 domain
MAGSTSIILVRQPQPWAYTTDKFWELGCGKPEYHDAMGSDGSISRKPTADDWEAHREKIKRLYIDDGLSLSDIQDALRQRHNFSAT